MITKMVSGGPAERCGRIRVGDILVAVDGRLVAGQTPNGLRPLIVGDAGTTVNLTLSREGSQFTVQLRRGAVDERKQAEPVRVERDLRDRNPPPARPAPPAPLTAPIRTVSNLSLVRVLSHGDNKVVWRAKWRSSDVVAVELRRGGIDASERVLQFNRRLFLSH
jgi:hypothetical protein